MRNLVSTGAVVAALVSMAAPAAAAPPVSGSGHVHHVAPDDGRCVPIDAVAFLAQSRGLHQGAEASGAGNGPEHGPC